MEEYEEGESFAFGVYIDVFPVDNIPDNMSERKFFYRKKKIWSQVHVWFPWIKF